jgi:branched-chain amino acid transport system substrate-binding protein
MSFSNSRRLGVALLITAALVAAGCGSSKTAAPATTVAPATTAAPTATTAAPAATTAAPAATTAAPAATTAAPAATTAAPADPLGKPNAAKGTPLKVGYIWSGVSAAIDNSEDLAAAQATAKWVNEYQGGVAGHPLELIPCATNEDPAIAAACGTQMVEAGVPAVLFNVNGQVGPWAKIVTAAKIPIIAFSTADPSVLAPGLDVFTLTNPIAGISSFPADLAKKAGYTKAAIIVIDVPGATGPVKAMAPPLFAAQGVPAVDLVAIAPGTADMSPQVQAELQKDPQGVHIIGNPAFCATAVKALRDASFKGTISMISNCLDPATIKALGTSLKGIVVSYAAGEKPDDPDYSAFKALAAKYSPDKKITPSGTPVGGFVVILGFSRMLAALKGDVTSASITTQIRANGPLPAPTLGAGKTFLCDGKQVPGISIACVKGIAYATLDDKGVAGDFGAF